MSLADKPVRRIVTVDDGNGESRALSDAPCADVRTDPARPGYRSTRVWVTDRTPARIKGVAETVHLPHALEPPPGGSVCRIVTFPPDSTFLGKVGEHEVRRHFAEMGSPQACAWSQGAPHPYRQQTCTLDLCLVLEGEITLVLDKTEVHLKAGDSVVQRATRHAWSNRSERPCVVAISSHDGRA